MIAIGLLQQSGKRRRLRDGDWRVLKSARALLLALIVAPMMVFVPLPLSSQEPPQTPQYDSSTENAARKPSENNPLKLFWDWTTHDAVSFYTFVLAIFTGVVGVVAIVQIGFLIRADKTTRITAEAARRSANAIQITERPYIFIWGIVGTAPTIIYTSSTDPKARKVVQDDAVFTYSVSNRGKLAAVIETVSIACGYEKGGHYPPLMMIGDHGLLQTPILSSEQDIENIAYNIPWRELDRSNPTPEFRDGLILRVVIAYREPFSSGHETSQCWRYVHSANSFAELADARYSYTR
jgi:hypothetical protein